MALLVLLDHHMVPGDADVQRWVATARDVRAIRTGALFEASTPAFIASGFSVIDRLTLLQLDLCAPPPDSPSPVTGSTDDRPRLRRLRPSMLDDAAALDRASFSAPWANDVESLTDIMHATPQHRSRCVIRDGRMAAFAISGRAGRWGYVQRLAVDTAARRQGLGRLLVDDALRWMARRRVDHVLVNTATDNHAALALYESCGFRPRPDGLTILERPIGPVDRISVVDRR